MENNEKPIETKPSVEEFGADRTQRCINLMNPEVRILYNLTLKEKIKKSEEIIKEAFKRYENVGLGFSGGGDSQALLFMTLKIRKHLPILFIDTRYEFPETIPYIKRLEKEWGFNVLTVKADTDKLEELRKKYGYGTPEWKDNEREFTIAFNSYHKIEPLMRGIKQLNLDAFLCGPRAVEHEKRATEDIFSTKYNLGHVRVHPILFWAREDVKEYLNMNNLPHHPLYDRGFSSLGSTIDTTPNNAESMHERAGRGVAREKAFDELKALGYI